MPDGMTPSAYPNAFAGNAAPAVGEDSWEEF